MLFSNVVLKLLPTTNASIRLVSASLVGFSLPAVHPDQRLLLFLHIPDDVGVGALPLFDLVGQYCFKLLALLPPLLLMQGKGSSPPLLRT